ncbi:hypothetical protein [Flavobacterium branchiicola]|uniref:Phospholipase D-like protein n=1 Tax=Flavobacterium branchiicola TaxID=1114875 RepID=A0ABV9PHW9_9FLAO|nr:hypothetical protein [Flavobacterium branchiicola]MBS7256306.1 hypothetical protein [Flavobacterium branchiicola]
MRNNPFITVILLFCIEIVLYIYLDYTELIRPSSDFTDFVMPVLCFVVPVIMFLISVFVRDMKFKKEFRNFSVFLLIFSTVLFVVLSYLFALGRGYQH